MVPSREPVRPIDTHAWVQHTNAVRGMMGMIPEGSEGAPTPIPPPPGGQQYPPAVNYHHSAQHHQQMLLNNGGGAGQQQQQRPASSSNTSNGSGGGGGARMAQQPHHLQQGFSPPPASHAMFMTSAAPSSRLDAQTSDRRTVVQAMAQPNSGLDIRDRTWLVGREGKGG